MATKEDITKQLETQVQKAYGLISLLCRSEAEANQIVQMTFQHCKTNQISDFPGISIEARRILKAKGAGVDLKTFEERLKGSNLSSDQLHALHCALVKLESLTEIAKQLNCDYASAGQLLRSALLAFRKNTMLVA